MLFSLFFSDDSFLSQVSESRKKKVVCLFFSLAEINARKKLNSWSSFISLCAWRHLLRAAVTGPRVVSTVAFGQRAAKMGGHLCASHMHSDLQRELPGLPRRCANCLVLHCSVSAPPQPPQLLSCHGLPIPALQRHQERTQVAMPAES